MSMTGYGGKHFAEMERNRQDNLARRERLEAEAVRKRLEARSGRGEGRAPLGGFLARMVADDAKASQDVSQTLDRLRKAADRPSFTDQDDARDESYVPEVWASRVGDAGGRFVGEARDRDHWGTGAIGDAMDVLTVEDFRHMQARRWRGRFF